MPNAVPSWRQTALTPDAMPARSRLTVLTATSAIGGFTRPLPRPARMKPGSRTSHAVWLRSVVMRVISRTPIAISAMPRTRKTFGPKRCICAPATGATNSTRPLREGADTGVERGEAQVVLQVECEEEEEREEASAHVKPTIGAPVKLAFLKMRGSTIGDFSRSSPSTKTTIASARQQTASGCRARSSPCRDRCPESGRAPGRRG